MSKQQKIRAIKEMLNPAKPPELPEIYLAPDGSRRLFIAPRKEMEKIKARFEQERGKE